MTREERVLVTVHARTLLGAAKQALAVLEEIAAPHRHHELAEIRRAAPCEYHRLIDVFRRFGPKHARALDTEVGWLVRDLERRLRQKEQDRRWREARARKQARLDARVKKVEEKCARRQEREDEIHALSCASSSCERAPCRKQREVGR